MGLSPRYRPFSLALARRHASRIFATSSHFPDFRFLAGFPSSASAIWRKICGRTSGFRSHSLSPMPQGMSRLSVMRTGSLNCENVKPFSRPHVRSRLVRTEGHRLIRFGLIRFEKPEGSSRIVPEQPLVLDLAHIQRPDDRSGVDVRRVINPFFGVDWAARYSEQRLHDAQAASPATLARTLSFCASACLPGSDPPSGASQSPCASDATITSRTATGIALTRKRPTSRPSYFHCRRYRIDCAASINSAAMNGAA